MFSRPPQNYFYRIGARIARSYLEWDGNLYYKHSDFQFRIGQAAIAQFKPRDGKRILEIGCGAGQLTIQIAKEIPRGKIIATDISQNMVETARETAAHVEVTNVQFACIDACAIQFDQEFDAIFSNATIHLIYHKKRLFERLYAALKPGGRAILTAGFTSLEATRKILERAHFMHMDLKMQDFEGDLNELVFVGQAAAQNLLAGASSIEAREKLLESIKQTALKSLVGFGIQVEGVETKTLFKQPILFISAKKGIE